MKLIRSVLVFFLLLVGYYCVFGQPKPGGGGGGKPCPLPPCPPVPITGIEVLIGIGSLLGAKKIHDLNKAKE